MDSFIEKMGLYDIFGILFSGMIAIVAIEVFLPISLFGFDDCL